MRDGVQFPVLHGRVRVPSELASSFAALSQQLAYGTHPPPLLIQVLHDTWSVIVTLHPETFSVLVAPFKGIQLPPYGGDSCIDSRDLCYDPRGWWRHAPALITTPPPTGTGRLHRVARGISATGLPRGAGSLNEPLLEGNVDEGPSSGGGRETAGEWSTHNCTGQGGWGLGRAREVTRVLVRAIWSVTTTVRIEQRIARL